MEEKKTKKRQGCRGGRRFGRHQGSGSHKTYYWIIKFENSVEYLSGAIQSTFVYKHVELS